MHRLLHISDTHLVAPGATLSPEGIDPAHRLDLVLQAVSEIGPAPDLIAHTGDVTDDGSRFATKRAYERLAGIAPTVAVPGNHDDPTLVAEVFGNPVTRLGAWQIIGIDTTIPDAVEGHSRGLAEVVAAATGPTVLLMHHPVRSRSSHHWFTVQGAEQAIDAFTNSPHPWLVLSGHTHEMVDEWADSRGRVRLLGGPATFYALRHTHNTWEPVPTGTGARMITLDDDGTVTVLTIAA